jgi:hypothetical protein
VADVSPQAQQAISARWQAAIIETYPGLTADFLRQEKDPFRNPVGAAVREGIPCLVAELFGAMDPGRISQALEGIVRIRAIQDFSPRQAVGFVFELRDILEDALPAPAETRGELDKRIDAMALLAFEIFMRCREQVYEVRLSEARRAVGLRERMASRNAGG